MFHTVDEENKMVVNTDSIVYSISSYVNNDETNAMLDLDKLNNVKKKPTWWTNMPFNQIKEGWFQLQFSLGCSLSLIEY